MSDWLKWTAPVAAVMSIAAPAYAIQYMTVEEAQKTAFPGASFAEVQAGRVWNCLLYTSPSPRDLSTSRMPSSA